MPMQMLKPMFTSLPCLLVAALAVAPMASAYAAEASDAGKAVSDATAEFQRVFSGNDAAAKRQVVRHYADRGTSDDDVVLPLLVAAVGDRQTHEEAVAALRERTGLKPPIYQGQSHYPGYPPSDHPQSWRYWLADRQRERDQDARIANALHDARTAKHAADDAEHSVNATTATK